MRELWGRPNAYNVQKALWTLRELELEFTHYDVGSRPQDLQKAEFLALNPHARIPVLRDEGQVLWESNTIVRYLAASYSEGDLWPRLPAPRALAERWMDWELCKLQPDFIALFWGYYRTPREARDAAQIESARESCRAHMRQLAGQLETSEYLGGDAFGIADIACGVCLYRYFEMGIDVERPAPLMRWFELMCQRKSFMQTVMQPFDELRGRLEY